MYHSISENSERRRPYYNIDTPFHVFAEHMRFLHGNRYASISLEEALEYNTSGKRCKCVVITFDDGYRNILEAAPELRRYGFKAIVFLPTAFIGDQPIRFNGRECLTWTEVRSLEREGILFGSHTVTHPQLIGLSTTELKEEIRRSKETIEEKLGVAVTSFCYPLAFPEHAAGFRRILRAQLQECGYLNGVCTVIGRATSKCDRYFLSRLPVNGDDDLDLFRAKLQGGYDWLHKLQYLSKKIGWCPR
jgi:peptidoglycan/xylan/chitin deacetylase (PgdA/CDA1 family)